MSLDQSVDALRSRLVAQALHQTPQTHARPPTAGQAREARQQAEMGHRLASKGQLAQAIRRFERSARLDPRIATTFRDLARAYGLVGRLDVALAAFRRAVEVDPDLADAHLGLAMLLEFLGREDEARAPYAEVIRLEPAQHAALARLAGIDGRAGRVAASQAGYRAAGVAARAAQSPAAALYEAHAELAAGRTAAAEAHMREAIAANPANAEALVVLGRVLLESGRADEAAASLEAALEVNPELDDGWGLLTGSRRFVEADRPKLALMETNLQRPQLYNGARLALHFALGKAYDDLGDYAVAIRHFDAANALRGAGRRLDRDWLERQTSDLIAATPPGFHEPSLGVGDATPILIVGMPRSGTTLVEQILSSHRRVAAGGELAFWRDNSAGRALLTGAQARRQAASLAGDYLATLRAISAEAGRVTDKMPSNFWRLGLIRQVFPRAAIVHCRRDPRDTCLSNYMTHFAAVDDYVSDRGDLAFYFRQYRRLMAHWREAMPAEGFVEVDYEALVADPETTTRWLVAACGLEWDDACLEPERNPRRITTASVWQARQPIYRASVERWRHYEPWLGELHTLAANAEPSS